MVATKSDGTARQHRATFARDKRNGGYLVRVEGPYANRFGGRKVPVTLRDGTEREIELDLIVWTGPDKESGKPVALYTHVPAEKIEEQTLDF